MTEHSQDIPPDDAPPFAGTFRTWPRLYAVVLLGLVGVVSFFAWLTERYS